jgi:serine/threonine protein kinase/Tol biopolymer transport system component
MTNQSDDSGRQPIATGTLIGSYRLGSLIGEGGMGSVYRAQDEKLNRPVAIKFLSDDFADAAARRRFQREAQMASSLNHPHLVTVYDAGEFEGRQYLVTEYVDGGTLKEWMRAGRRDWSESLEVLAGVADGLAEAHDAGIMHRDIKPGNILITRSGYAKLADFGLAKAASFTAGAADESTRTMSEAITRAGALLGTIAYMSPEQASGKTLDARSDIFSFAVVLYEMVAGRRPFEGATELEVLQRVIHAPPAPLPAEIPAAVGAVIERGLQKDPAQRYPSMRELVSDLRRLVRQSAEVSAGHAHAQRKRSGLRLAAAATGVLAVAAVVGFLVMKPKSPVESGSRQYTQLTNVDSAIAPALSPDGRMLAFVRGVGTAVQSTADPTEIYIKQLPDGDPVQLTHDRVPYKNYPRFSPDGSRIAYMTLETAGFNTYVVPVIGGEGPHRLLTNGEGLNWIYENRSGGPPQLRILFSYMTGKGVTMGVASATESRSDERNVFTKDGYMAHFSELSPDGKQLLLAEMGPSGLFEACRLAPFDGSSEGKKVGPQPSDCQYVAWSRDQKWMYFSADVGDGTGFHVWRQRWPDGKPEQVTSGPAEEEGVFVAPDGRSLVSSVGSFQNKIWVHDARGDRQVTSESYSFSPSFSADGKKLYYLVRKAGGVLAPSGQLWVTDLETGRRQRLIADFQMWQYNVSSDGKRVVLAASKESGRQGVWLATLDGSAPPRQFTSKMAYSALFGSNGYVYFGATDSGMDAAVVYRVKEDGSDLRRAIPDPTFFLEAVSPDGQYVAVDVPAPMAETGTGATAVYRADGTSPVTVCICGNRALDAPPAVTWSADGRTLYVSLVGGQSVYAIPLRPGEILPPLPKGGIRSAEDVLKLPGAKLLPASGEFPGPGSMYAFPKFTSQRNVFRIPVQ